MWSLSLSLSFSLDSIVASPPTAELQIYTNVYQTNISVVMHGRKQEAENIQGKG